MVTTSAVILLVTLSVTSVTPIRVPTDWNSDSDVSGKLINEPSSAGQTPVPVPVEYFQYPDKKPQFAVEVAAFHGVQNPEQHYKAYSIRPYTGQQKPELGKHKILDQNNPVFQQFQQYAQINEDNKIVTPASSSYEVFHPYEAEEPALQAIYKDPVLDKIRNDIYNSHKRLQKYENEAGKPEIQDGEYLESPEQTDRKKIPQRNVLVPYERHRPQRRPVYYRPGPNFSREQVLNQKFRHPWNQQNAKIRPVHYRPLKNHIHRLRQQHAVKFDDERNEYPQMPTPEQYAEVPEGYDIYERGKAKFVALRNNVDESINNAVKENRPTIHQKLELQNNGERTVSEIRDAEEPDFIPVKNYAQVRKTETMKHLPRAAAFEDAASFDEIRNAPRLREAVKSTKAQTVYSEEGYEDAAYDHAGEEKHAAENEGHGGYLNEKEISGGKYKAPELSGKYQEASGNEYRDQTLHGEKWKNSDKDKVEEVDEEDYEEDDVAESVEADVYDEVNGERNKRQNTSGKESADENEDEQTSDDDSKENQEAAVERSKRENKFENSTLDEHSEKEPNATNVEHELKKRETKDEVQKFKIPDLDLNSTFLTEEELFKMAKLTVETQPKKENIKDKYPYYFRNLKTLHKHSPLRYAENLKLIPKKSKGGTEFYDSRSILECPEVDDDVDPIPEKLKKEGHPDSDESDDDKENNKKKGQADFDQLKKKRRLKGLGDKIDCFKAKYFGENPLDSPFFKEELISNPEPITAPTLPTYKLRAKEPLIQASTLNNVFNASEKLKENSKHEISDLFDKLKNEQENLQGSLVKTNDGLRASLAVPQNFSILSNSKLSQQTNVYADILDNIKNNRPVSLLSGRIEVPKDITLVPSSNYTAGPNATYISYQNKEEITQLPPTRKKRGAPFMYEPYKIIRDGQVQESKKTTTTSNISPLIKKLQSSKVVDRVAKSAQSDKNLDKQNETSRNYKDIGRKDREKNAKPVISQSEARFIDVNVDQRRGEPRYEIRIPNHKAEYTPVDNKKAMSVEDYEAQTNKTIKKPEVRVENRETASIKLPARSRQIPRPPKPTVRPFFDVSQFIPKAEEVQKTSASNTVKNVVKSPQSNKKVTETNQSNDKYEDEDYEEYDDDEEEVTTTTTTTTKKPSFRRRRTTTSTTTTTTEIPEEELVYPKLRLITRFRSTVAPITTEKQEPPTEKPIIRKKVEDESPKYREKKKKTSKSTLVTDTKTYGDDKDSEMMKEEVDAMIGVQQDMDEYMPQYEKEVEKSRGERPISSGSDEDEEDSEEDDDEEFDDDDEDEDDTDEISDESESEEEPKVTTPEPTKRTLVRTTEAPVSTTETRNAKLEQRPIVHKKTIEIHKEIPMNRSLPHSTQFKQDIKEVEIIKEMPPKPKQHRNSQRKPQKNLEALELYKDDELAKEINKLGAVEIFKEDLDLEKGPKHGGNYRIATKDDLLPIVSTTIKPTRTKKPIKDTDTSQSKNAKLVELTDVLPARRLHSRMRNSGRSAKLELVDTTNAPKKLHGGNLKSISEVDRRRGGNRGSKNAKLIEFDDENHSEEDSSHDMHGGNFKNFDSVRSSGKPLHGGNYRSAKIIQKKDEDVETTTEKAKSGKESHRSKAAVLLNSFAQAVPILTSTPAYILDPSKRMYYYVDDK